MKIKIYSCIQISLTVILFSCRQPGAVKKEINTSRKPNNSREFITRGEYLVTITGCNDCHSPHVIGPNGPEIDSSIMLSGYPSNRPVPEFPDKLIRSGLIVVNSDLTAAMGPWGTSFAANLTSDQTGIGNWSEMQFKNALTHGRFKGIDNARPLMPPMPWKNLQHLQDQDIKAIFAYLKSTRPVHNVVPAFRPVR